MALSLFTVVPVFGFFLPYPFPFQYECQYRYHIDLVAPGGDIVFTDENLIKIGYRFLHMGGLSAPACQEQSGDAPANRAEVQDILARYVAQFVKGVATSTGSPAAAASGTANPLQ
jgi:hypothetical protein